MFLAYAGPKGRALVDRELYLPRSWTGDQQRLAAAWSPGADGVPDQAAAAGADDRPRGRGRHPVRLGHVTLAMLALAFLAVTRAALAGGDAGLASSANEIGCLFTALCGPPPDEQHARRWSRWRHRHRNAPADVTTSGNNYKITECGWVLGLARRQG